MPSGNQFEQAREWLAQKNGEETGRQAASTPDPQPGRPARNARGVNGSYIARLLAEIKDVDDDAAVGRIRELIEVFNSLNTSPLASGDLKVLLDNALKTEKKRRVAENQKAIDQEIGRQITEAEDAPPAPGGPAPGAGNGPAWHLVIIQGDPVECLLRSPFWSASPALKGGYLRTTREQLFDWRAIRKLSLGHAQQLPPLLARWSAPGGHLEQLIRTAELRPVVPEGCRALYMVGFLFRYLKQATERLEDDAGVKQWPSNGRPSLDEEGNVYFKFSNLKAKIANSPEDFRHQEISSLLEEHGRLAWPDRNRWWKFTAAKIKELGRLAGETPYEEGVTA